MRSLIRLSFIIVITVVVTTGCKKDEEPFLEDNFVGEYVVQDVIEEYNPTDPEEQDEAFLAPATFDITKSDFLNPATGEMIASYKFFIDTLFMGVEEQSGSGGTVLVGTQGCPNDENISGVSVTLQIDGLYRLNMLNCIGREIIADYNKIIQE